jgi:hypothetical protein
MLRLLAYYDWILTPEGRDFLNLGFEGVDWYVNEEGKAVETRPMDEETRAMVPLWNIYKSMGALGIGGPKAYTPSSQPPRWTSADLFYYTRDMFDPLYAKNIYDPNIDITFMSTPLKDEWLVSWYDVEAKINETVIMPVGVGEREWRAYVDVMLNVMGGQAMIDEVNAVAKELGY